MNAAGHPAASQHEDLAALWQRHLASPRPRAWLGPFGGRAWRGSGLLESIVLTGPPQAARMWQLTGRHRRRRDAPPLTLVEERARALGRTGMGFVSYDYAGLLEELPPPPGPSLDWPLLRFDFHRVEERLEPGFDSHPAAWAGPRGWSGPAGPLEPEDPRDHFRRGVQRVRDLIRAGDCYQINLVQAFAAALAPGGAPALFAALRRHDPADGGYRALLEWRGRALVCDSPELFLARRGAHLWTRPIKGTVRRETGGRMDLPPVRGAGPADEAVAARLLASGKDRAELAMIVDLLRNDLSRVCRPGSVRTGPFPELMWLPHLLHTCALVEGELRPGRGLQEIFQAAFPCGSVTGCPRRRAMERIAGLESRPRGPCFGAVGWVDAAGDFEFAVAIRTALHQRGGLRLLAGGGITIDSTPAAEEEESRLKTASYVAALAGLAGRPG
ncbi:MAG: chorismate-binding protein [bacterium]|nr:chorismate-binding protein [bacterium]